MDESIEEKHYLNLTKVLNIVLSFNLIFLYYSFFVFLCVVLDVLRRQYLLLIIISAFLVPVLFIAATVSILRHRKLKTPIWYVNLSIYLISITLTIVWGYLISDKFWF